jgi:uncharacterized transporter YbjL
MNETLKICFLVSVLQAASCYYQRTPSMQWIMQTIFGILALLLFLNLLLLLLSVNREKQKKAFQSFYSKIEKARRDCYT